MILLQDVPKLVEELLQPIPGENPSGENLQYDKIYDDIREARREEEDLNQGAWQTERKVADLVKTISLSTDALKNRTKDIQIAAWLADALLRKEYYSGLVMGLQVLRGLIDKFWDTVYPPIDEDDLEMRAAPLGLLSESTPRTTTLEIRVREVPLNREGHNWYQYDESRAVGYEDQAKDPAQKKKREKDIADKKLTPEIFDKSFKETPKAFYVTLEKGIDESLISLAALAKLCDDKFGNSAPSCGKLKTALETVRKVAHALLEKKRETEPDPVEAPPPEALEAEAGGEAGEAGGEASGETAVATRPQAGYMLTLRSSESPARGEQVNKVASAAAWLRQKEPYSPAPYLMLRGLRWGDLRTAAWQSDPAMLEAPPSDVRQQIKRLALDQKWKEVLEFGEVVMALPCSRAWLDLQRFIVEACVALGRDYDPIAVAIRSELRCLLRDVPQLLEATLMDDTPAANNDTRKWLRDILKEPADGTSSTVANIENGAGGNEENGSAGWQRKFIDSSLLAKEALRSGQPEKAIEIMSQELNRQRSARGKFQRRIQFVELCVAANKDAIVQPMLDDLIATIDAHKLEEWEDKTMVAAALVTIARASKKIQANAAEKQKLFERVCRLDPIQALNF